MNCLEALTMKDLNDIAKRLSYNNYSGSVPEIEDLKQNWLSHWAKGKEAGNLFSALGNKLIVSKKININGTSPFVYSDICHFFEDTETRRFLTTIRNYFDTRYSTPAGHNSIVRNKLLGLNYYYDEGKHLKQNLIEINVNNPIEIEDIVTRKTITIKGKNKLTRLISKLIVKPAMEDNDMVTVNAGNKYISFISTLTNCTTISGTLCLSIHPMDYMTMSDNVYGWRSCMSWEEGEYRIGTLEMLTSPCVVVAYIQGDKDKENKWFNKRWRELFIVTPELIKGIKGYPYSCPHLEDYIIKELAALATENNGWTYRPDLYMAQSSYSYPQTYDEDLQDIKIYLSTDRMYNDTYSHKDNHIMFGTGVKSDDTIDIYYSGQAYCIESFEAIENPYSENQLVCNNYVVDRFYCDCCGQSYYSEETECYTLPDGAVVCEECYFNYRIEDTHTGDTLGWVYGNNCVLEDENIPIVEVKVGYASWYFSQDTFDEVIIPNLGEFFEYTTPTTYYNKKLFYYNLMDDEETNKKFKTAYWERI